MGLCHVTCANPMLYDPDRFRTNVVTRSMFISVCKSVGPKKVEFQNYRYNSVLEVIPEYTYESESSPMKELDKVSKKELEEDEEMDDCL